MIRVRYTLRFIIKRAGCLLLVVIMFFCTGCDAASSESETMNSTIQDTTTELFTEATQGPAVGPNGSTGTPTVFTVDNSTPADRLITKEYSLEEMKNWLISRSPIDGYLPDIFTLHRDSPFLPVRFWSA